MARRKHPNHNEKASPIKTQAPSLALAADLPEFLTVLIKKGTITEDESKEYLERAAGLEADFNMKELVQYSKKHEEDFPKFIYCALQDPGIYERVVTKVDDLKVLIKAFPEHAEAFLAPLLASPEAFRCIVTDSLYFQDLIKACPKQVGDLLIDRLLEWPEESQRIFTNRFNCLIQLKRARSQKQAADLLITQLLESQGKDQNAVFFSPYELSKLKAAFPEHAKALITPLLESLERYYQLNIRDADSLGLVILIKTFPEHAKALIAPLLASPEAFWCIVTDPCYLEGLIKACPEQVGDLLIAQLLEWPEESQRIFKNNPNSLIRLIKFCSRQQAGHLLLDWLLVLPEEKYQRIVTDVSNFIELVMYYPDHEEALIARLLDPKEFQRIVTKAAHLPDLIKVCSRPHSIDKLNKIGERKKQLADMPEFRPWTHGNNCSPYRKAVRTLHVMARACRLTITPPPVPEQNNAEATNTSNEECNH